jgi:hypothetical protein
MFKVIIACFAAFVAIWVGYYVHMTPKKKAP